MDGTIRRSTLEMGTCAVSDGTDAAPIHRADDADSCVEGPEELPTDPFAEAVDEFIAQARNSARRRMYGATWTEVGPLTSIPLDGPTCSEHDRPDEA